ncbi:hypothetical protein LguiB_021233 [Lonicera macranthoides]
MGEIRLRYSFVPKLDLGDGRGDRDFGCGVNVIPNSDEVKNRAEGGGDCEEVEVGFVGSEFLHFSCLLEDLSSMEVLERKRVIDIGEEDGSRA